MPNGIDKNLVRLSWVVEEFHRHFGHWPKRAVLNEISLRDVRALLGPDFLAEVEKRIRFVSAEAGFRVEDDQGHWMDYASGLNSGLPEIARGDERRDPPMPGWHWLGLTDWHGPPGHTPSWRDHF